MSNILLSSKRFEKVDKRPRWEGIVFTDIDFNNSQISVLHANPAEELNDYIESIWFMNWDINNPQGMQCILTPNPCTKLVTLNKDSKTFRPIIVSVREKADIFNHTGKGSTVGIDFRPGALYRILKRSIKTLPESGLFAEDLLDNFPSLPNDKWSNENLSQWLTTFENYLIEKLVGSEEHNYNKIFDSIEGILDGSFQSPEDLSRHCCMSIRTLQRVFQKEVGLSPRDVLRIARFNRSIQQIGQDDFISFAEVALASGFFDQAHMINEFKKLVSTPPSKFKLYL